MAALSKQKCKKTSDQMKYLQRASSYNNKTLFTTSATTRRTCEIPRYFAKSPTLKGV